MPNDPTSAGLPPKEAIAFFRAKQLKPSFDYRDTWREEHATAFSVAKATSLDVLSDIRAGVDTALADGKTFDQFKKELTPLLQQKGWWGRKEVTDPVTGKTLNAQLGSPRRLRTIYESNVRTALAAGHWEKAQRTKRAMPYFLYQLGPSERHRPAHVALEGTMLPVDDPFWDTHYPPNGWGCKCWLRQITKYEFDKLSRDGVPSQGDPVLDDKGLPTGRVQPRTIPAKTTAPKVSLRSWRNTRTGKIEQVPQGIDPGWDTNPGKARHAKATQLLSQKKEAVQTQLASPTFSRRSAAQIREIVSQSPTKEAAFEALALPSSLRSVWKLDGRITKASKPSVELAKSFLSKLVHKDYSSQLAVSVHTQKGFRAYYSIATRKAHIPLGNTSTTIHELAHHLEIVFPEILALSRRFLKSRLRPNEKIKSLRSITNISRYRSNEVAFEDDWVLRGGSVYMGKVYDLGRNVDTVYCTEVLTMGLERLFSNPVAFAKQDPDYFDFLLKTLQKLD